MFLFAFDYPLVNQKVPWNIILICLLYLFVSLFALPYLTVVAVLGQKYETLGVIRHALWYTGLLEQYRIPLGHDNIQYKCSTWYIWLKEGVMPGELEWQRLQRYSPENDVRCQTVCPEGSGYYVWLNISICKCNYMTICMPVICIYASCMWHSICVSE